MTAIVKGVLEQVWINEQETKFGTKKSTTYVINGTRYSGGFKKPAADKGDEVELVYDDTSQYRNVKSITVVGKGSNPTPTTSVSTGGGSGLGKTYRQPGTKGGFPLDPQCYERALDRRNALNAAVTIAVDTSNSLSSEDIISLARTFEAYTTGDLDREAAEKALNEQDSE